MSDVLAQRTGISTREGFQIFVSDIGFRDDAPALASNGSEWLVAWGKRGTGTYDLRGERPAAPARSRASSASRRRRANQDTPSAFDAGSHLVAWHDRRTSSPDVYAGTGASTTVALRRVTSTK